MKYYKWIWEDSPKIHMIPGFVWADAETAKEKYEDFCDWTYGDTDRPRLYVMEEAEPTDFPLAFCGRLCYNPNRVKAQPLDHQDLEEALDHFSSVPVDFFSTNAASENDVLLFMRIAATLRVIKSAFNPVLDEYFIGVETTMVL